MNTDTKITSSVSKLPGSQVAITASIPGGIFDATRSKAITHLAEHVELPGFRKGHVPEKVLIGKLGEAAILEEMAEITISKAYPILIDEYKLDVLGRPEIKITKIAPGEALEFTLTTAIFPELTLPDYKSIAAKSNKKKEAVSVSDDEVEKTINEIRKIRAKNIAQESGKEFDEKAELPPLDDETVKTLGKFDNVTDFETKLRENIAAEKTRSENEKHRVGIIEAILEKVEGELPDIIIDQELARMKEEFSGDIARMGMQFDDYLKQLGKTHDDIKKDWREEAIKRGKVQLMVSEIARKENLAADEKSIETEMQKLHIMYPTTPLERIRSYVDMILTNNKVFEFLESQGS